MGSVQRGPKSANKMKLIVLLSTIVLVSAKSIRIDQLEYGFCEGADTSLGSIDAVDVQPFPVEVKTGGNVTISATLSLATTVPAGAKVALNITKEGIVDLPFPCSPIFPIGSCEYEADDLLDKFSDILCPAHVPEGQTCATPLNPGTYGGDPPLTFQFPWIPSIWDSPRGTYYAEATIKNSDGNPMTCLYVRVEVLITGSKPNTTTTTPLSTSTTSTSTTTSLGLALSGLTATLGLVLFSALL